MQVKLRMNERQTEKLSNQDLITPSSHYKHYKYVGILQNIYFNVKDSEDFDKFVLQNWVSWQIH